MCQSLRPAPSLGPPASAQAQLRRQASAGGTLRARSPGPAQPSSLRDPGTRTQPALRLLSSVQFSPVPQSRPALCKPMDCSTPGLPVHQQLPQFTKNSSPLSRWCHPTISSSVIPFSCHLQSFPALGSFQMSQFFASGGQSIGVSVSASILPMHIQD